MATAMRPDIKDGSRPVVPVPGAASRVTSNSPAPIFPTATASLSSIPLSSLPTAAATDVFSQPISRSVSMPLDRGSTLAMAPMELSVHGASRAKHATGVHAIHARSGMAGPLQGPHVLGTKAASPEVLQRMMMSIALSQANPKVKANVKLEKPPCVPTGPFRLTDYVLPLTCKMAELRSAVEGTLKESAVDFEYNDAKWKAKCYMYKPQGHCQFVLRMYTEAREGVEHFLVEMQRRRGCGHVFRGAYDKVLRNFASRGLLAAESAAHRRALALNLVRSPSTQTEYPPAFSGDADPSDDDDTTSASAPVTSEEAHSIVDALNNMATMLSSEFDDICTPAAQSIASLTVSRRIRATLGARALMSVGDKGRSAAVGSSASALPAQAGLARQQSNSTVASSASSAGLSSIEKADASIVVQILKNLVTKASAATASIECRTACMIALDNLVKDPSCVESLNSFHAPLMILGCFYQLPISAQTAAFRRAAACATDKLISACPPVPGAATTRDWLAFTRSIINAPGVLGHDAASDAHLKHVVDMFEQAARTP